MHLWRLRVEVRNEPGQLARVAEVLARAGANIVSLDVHAAGASSVVDDMVVASVAPLDAVTLAGVLAPLDARLVDVCEADAHELVDRTTSALDTAARIADGGPDLAALGAAIAQLVRADIGYVRPVGDGLLLPELEARAAADDRPVMGRHPVKVLGAGVVGAWVLAVPTAVDGRPHVAVVVRRAPRFSYTETARVRALLGLSVAVQRSGARDRRTAPGGRVIQLRDGGEVVLRRMRDDDEQGVVRMHRRCSRATTQRRYLSSMRELPPRLLRLLVDVDGRDRIALVAACGSELVGSAHLTGRAGGVAEVAVIVEDAHQRRGIGIALLQACAREARDRGVRSLTATCLADNDAFPALVAACGFQASQRLDDGVRLLTIPLTASEPAVTAPDDSARRDRAARDHRLWWAR
jgi:GNAT superfamily N-acetyltransferase/acetolactate synthase regulatory subunit